MPTQLQCRSFYSLLQSPINIKDYVKLASDYGYNAIALTDYKVMHGTIPFYNECRKYNIKPLIGLEFDLNINNNKVLVMTMAKNDLGFKSLMHISSYINSGHDILEIDDLRNHLDDAFLFIYTEGSYLENIHGQDLKNELIEIKKMIPNFIIPLSNNEAKYYNNYNYELKKICLDLDIFTCAFNKVHYLNKEDVILKKVLKAIDQNKQINDTSLVVSNNYYLKTIDELYNIYSKEDIKNADRIAFECNVYLQLEKTSLPKFEVKNNISSKDYLVNLCRIGLNKRLNGHVSKEYVERLNHELKVIIKMNFIDYFLIVYDFVRFAKSNGIYTGPGRGSAAGSLVSYCLGISSIDPLKYGLLFERFLNPERVSMPDIDLDVPDIDRNRVIDYITNKYGDEHCAHIVTFNTLASKQVIRDVSRVLGISNYNVDMITKAIPNVLKITLKKAYEESTSFRQIINSDAKFREMFALCLRLEGIPRHTSIHAAGIVLSSLPLNEVIPTMKLQDGTTITQYTMEYLEDLGLIKMDLLGLRNLTIIDEIVKEINKDQPFNIYQIPLDDIKTYNLIQEANTQGVFQLESMGMKKLLLELKPRNFEEIGLTIALFRPGPMQNIETLINNRKDERNIHYLHEDLKPILKDTYGIIVYQEQIMQIAVKMASFSLSKADILRKAMSKKKKEELVKLKEDFIDGCIKNHYARQLAEDIYELILRFADYGFNKSHSIAYGLISYQLAYLKANYPLYFYKSLLNNSIGSSRKTSEYLYEAKKVIEIKGLSINNSVEQYRIKDFKLYLPLSLIKNISINIAKTIVNERNKNGLFKDYFDFVVRAYQNKVNRASIESLIYSGAMDEFKYTRNSMLKSLDEAIEYAELVTVDNQENLLIDLGLVSKPLITIAKDDKMNNSIKEKEVLGFNFSDSVLQAIKNKYNIDMEPLIAIEEKRGYVKGIATITRIKQHRTKKGDLMAFVNVMDETSDLDLVIMPNLYQKYNNILSKQMTIIFDGNIDEHRSVLVKNIKIIKETL